MSALRTLPWSWYSDPEILRREQERIFRRAWQYVGHAGQVQDVGDRFAAWAGDVPVLVVRAEEGLRAFLNVCRHRGSLLAESAGTGKIDPVPLPRVDVRARRLAPGRAALGAGGGLRGGGTVPASRCASRRWGPFLLRQPRRGRAAARRDARPAARLRPRRRPRLPLPRRVRARRELEDRLRELPRVLPLPRRAQGLQRGLRRRPRRVPARADRRARPVPVRTHARGGGRRRRSSISSGRTSGSTCSRERRTSRSGRCCRPARSARRPSSTTSSPRTRTATGSRSCSPSTGRSGAEDRVLVERVQKGVRSGILDEGRLLDKSEQLVARFQELVGTALS